MSRLDEPGDGSDFLLVTQDGPFRRHRPLAITLIVIVIVLLALLGWEVLEANRGGNASLAASSTSPAALLGLPSPSRTLASPTRPQAEPSPVTVTQVVPGPGVTATVTTTVAAPDTLIVPDVRKLPYPEAKQVLDSLGYTVVADPLTPPPGDAGLELVAQNPAQGTVVSPGSTVTLTYFGTS